MGAVSIITIVLLVLAIGLFILLAVSQDGKAKKLREKNELIPFNGTLAPPSPPWTVNLSKANTGSGKKPEDGLLLLGMRGGTSDTAPQIQCPVGSKINIVGAFLDINDPYGECSNTPNSTLKLSCGDGSDTSTAPSCTDGDDSTCPPGMTCYSAKCVPLQCSSSTDCTGGGVIPECPSTIGSTCSSNTDCGSGAVCTQGTCQVDPGAGPCTRCDPGTNTCVNLPTCFNVEGGLNNYCSPTKGDKNLCRPRDASAWLASVCDGQQECISKSGENWLPNQQGGAFGPLPCHISAKSGDDTYSNLPIIQGWGGGAPQASSTGAAAPSNFNQGYKVHGIYTCIPDDE